MQQQHPSNALLDSEPVRIIFPSGLAVAILLVLQCSSLLWTIDLPHLHTSRQLVIHEAVAIVYL